MPAEPQPTPFDAWWEQPPGTQSSTDSQYGDVVITKHVPTVEHAPERSLMSVALLRDMHGGYLIGANLLHIGRLVDGTDVFYRITGWDAEQKALIIERHHRG